MKRNQFFQLFTLASASLTATIGGSCHKYNFCRDKHVFCRDKTRVLSRQKYACGDKHVSVATNILSRQT